MSWTYLLNQYQWWLTAAMGVVAGMLAFIAGRRFLFRAPAKTRRAGDEPAAIDPFICASPSERRLAARRTGNAVEVGLLDPEGNRPPVEGWVVNRSLGGLCLEVDSAVAVGATVKIKIRNSAANIEPLDIVVKSCQMVGSSWQLHCKFVSSPTFNVLLMFG